jgi:hypothetical protein
MTNAQWKNLVSMANCGINFFDHHPSFFTTMNAPPICKMHNGVNKTPQFLLFSTSKSGTKTIAHFSIAEG